MKEIKYEIRIPEGWTYDIYNALRQYCDNPTNFDKSLLSDATQEHDDATKIMSYFKGLRDETEKQHDRMWRDDE